MKIDKKIYYRFIYYEFLSDDGTNIEHGFYNDHNEFIGYHYQNKYKGFWLDKCKI
jgi:hypothetical protein